MKYDELLAGLFDFESGEFNYEEARRRALNEKDKCNIIICGASGVGKSTLINAIFGKEVVRAGVGKPITQHLEKIDIPEKGMCFWDTKGIEAEDYDSTMEELKSEFKRAIDEAKDDRDIPHVGWVCIKASSDRVEPRDLKLIGLLYEYKIPVVVVFTRVIGKAEKEFVEEAKRIIDGEYSDFVCGSYVSVNSVPYDIDDDLQVPPKGLDDLVILTEIIFPDGKETARRAFLKAQQRNQEKRFNAMKDGAENVVHISAAAAAGAGALPIPGSDAPIIAAIQSAMIYKINAEFELDEDSSKMASILTGILGVTTLANVGKTVVANMLKFIPGAGTIVGGAISGATAAAITEAVGHAYIKVLEECYDMKEGRASLPVDSDLIVTMFSGIFDDYVKSKL